MLKAVTIKDGHANFFTPLRFIFAYMVLIGHSFVVVGGSHTSEPHIFFHFTFSYLAVNLFFIASGFLVTGSMLYRKDAASFVSARVLRIYPGLIAHVLLMIVVFGAMTTSLPLVEYFTHADTLKQPFIVLPFIESSMHLPNILENNHEHQASAALWTLRYELLAYVGTLVAFFLGLLKHRWMLLAQFVVFAIALPVSVSLGIYDSLPATIQSLLRFGVCYGLGTAIYGYRDKIRLHFIFIPILFGFSALIHNTVMFEVSVMVSLGYMLFWMAYVDIPKLNFLQKISDVSYGIYIYHWAVIQGIHHFWPSVNVWQLIALGSPIAILLAHLSWRFVEKPALALKPKFANMLKRKKQTPLNV